MSFSDRSVTETFTHPRPRSRSDCVCVCTQIRRGGLDLKHLAHLAAGLRGRFCHLVFFKQLLKLP